MYFVVTLFASFTFGWAFYVATVERQRRLARESDGSQPLPSQGADSEAIA